MTLRRQTLAALSLAGLLALPWAAARAGTPDDADSRAIRETLQRYEQALNRADVATIIGLYSPDGVLLAPDAPAASGRDGLAAAYDATFRAIALDLRFTVDELAPLGPGRALLRSHSAGTLRVQGSGQPAAPAAFKELFLLARQADGQWKFTHYSFSTAPAQP